MRDPAEMSLAELERELYKARDEENAAYWRFTRCARGSPVPMVEISQRIARLRTLIALKGGD